MSMTESEAIEWLGKDTSPMKIHIAEMKNENPMEYINEAIEVAIASIEEIKQYRAIGTVSEFRELKEKATAKKLKHGVCPNCSTNNDMIIKNLGNPQGHKTIFCWNCGSAIDWSKGKE